MNFWSLKSKNERKAKEFFGFALDSELDLESFLNIVHPEDRARLRLSVEEAVRSGKDYGTEYRIVRPSGSVRKIFLLIHGRATSGS
jgi:PAS domain-containing protein